MKISKKLNHSTWFKFLIAIPLIFLLYYIFLLYNSVGILSASLQEPHSLKIFIDDLIPYVPWIIVPYLFVLLFPLTGLVFAFYKKITAVELSALYVALMLLILSSYVIYLIFPTSAESIMLNTSQFDFNLFPEIRKLDDLYNVSIPYNAFPSLHVSPLVFLSIFVYKKWRTFFWISLPLVILGSAGTVLTKFHFFADILGGIAMGYFTYYILYKKVALKIFNKVLQDA